MTLSLYGDQYAAATDRARSTGKRATDQYLDRATTFNAGDALTKAAGGLFDQFEHTTGQRINDLRGSMVGSGRLGGGYGEQDEDSLIYDAKRDLNDKIAGLSLQATGMDQQNTQQLGQFGQGQEGQYLDLLSGGMDREMADQNAKANRKASLWGSLAGLAGTLGGSFLGPVGAAVGGKLASKLVH